MKIVEDYIRRNNLQEVPIVQHCDSLFFIARPRLVEDNMGYLYMTSNWIERSKGPGSYMVKFFSPQKVGKNWMNKLRHQIYADKSFMFKEISTHTVEYEDYETFMFNWMDMVYSSSDKWIVAKNRDDALFMVWESFVYIFDVVLSEFPAMAKVDLWESLNAGNGVIKRQEHIRNTLGHICSISDQMHNVWLSDVCHHMDSYCDWMSECFSRVKPEKIISVK